MKLRLLSLIAVVAMTTGLNAIVGDVLRMPGRAAAGVTSGLTGRGYYRGGDRFAGEEMHNRPLEKVSAGTYEEPGQLYAPVELGNELSVNPQTGSYHHFLNEGAEPRFGNFLTPRY